MDLPKLTRIKIKMKDSNDELLTSYGPGSDNKRHCSLGRQRSSIEVADKRDWTRDCSRPRPVVKDTPI